VDLYKKVLADKGARVVVDPYTYSFAGRSKPKHTLKETLRAMARDHIIIPLTLNLDRRIEYFNNLIVEYDLDGIIMHANQSCRPSSTGLYDLQDALQKRWGIPVLMMNTDHCDPRAYSEGPMNTRIDIVAQSRMHLQEGIRANHNRLVNFYRRFGWPPERVAKAILSAVRHNRSIVPVGPEAWAQWFTKRMSQKFFDAMSEVSGRFFMSAR